MTHLGLPMGCSDQGPPGRATGLALCAPRPVGLLGIVNLGTNKWWLKCNLIRATGLPGDWFRDGSGTTTPQAGAAQPGDTAAPTRP